MRIGAGFTFVELLVVVVLMLAMTGFVLVCAIDLSDSWQSATTQLDVRTEAEQAVARMAAELQQATRTAATNPPNSPPNIAIATPNNQMTFFLPHYLYNGNSSPVDPATGQIAWGVLQGIVYRHVPSQQQIERVAGTTTVWANNVTALAFTDRSSPGFGSFPVDKVQIQLTMQRITPRQRTVTATATGVVKLRN